MGKLVLGVLLLFLGQSLENLLLVISFCQPFEDLIIRVVSFCQPLKENPILTFGQTLSHPFKCSLSGAFHRQLVAFAVVGKVSSGKVVEQTSPWKNFSGRQMTLRRNLILNRRSLQQNTNGSNWSKIQKTELGKGRGPGKKSKKSGRGRGSRREVKTKPLFWGLKRVKNCQKNCQNLFFS